MFRVSVVDDEIQTHSLDSHYTQIPIGKGQNKEVSQSARVPIATFCSNQSSGLTCWVCSHAVKVPLLHHESSFAFQLDGACQVSQLTRVKLHFSIGNACQVSHLRQVKMCLLIGSVCQASQENKCIHIQVDCRIHSKVPEPIAARFGGPLIVECLFNYQA